MLVKEYVQDVETFGIEETSGFKIKASAKAFKILIGNLYSDPVTAIIRELSCNAYDAHVAAGKKNVPFKVKLPNQLDSTFYVQDFGTGLSHNDVMNLYTTFFDSTKTGSNDYIGALGLGSKTPFAYVGSFTVISVFEGKKRSYTAYMNEKGSPVISLLGEEDTTEEPGLMVHFAVQPKDHNEFIHKARAVYHWFDIKPEIVGVTEFKHSSIVPIVHGDNWSIVEGNSNHYDYRYGYGRHNNSSIYAVMGNIAYPLNGDHLNENFQKISGMLYSSGGAHLHINVPIGKLDIAASREDLHYDEETIANLNEILDALYRDLVSRVQEEIDKIESKWDILDLLSNRYRHSRRISSQNVKDKGLFAELLYALINDSNYKTAFTWRGKSDFLKKEFDMLKYEKPDNVPIESMVFFSKTGYSNPVSRKIILDENWFDKIGDLPQWVNQTWMPLRAHRVFIGATGSWSSDPKDYKKYISLSFDHAGYIVIDDTPKGHMVAKTVKHYAYENSIDLKDIIVIRNVEGKNSLTRIKKFLEIPEDRILKVSDMEKPPVEKREKPKQVLSFEGWKHMYHASRNRRCYSYDIKPTRDSWMSLDDADVPTSGVYVELYNNKVASNKKITDEVTERFVEDVRALHIIGDETVIYGIRSNHIQNIDKKNWMSLESYVKKALTKYFKNSKDLAMKIALSSTYKDKNIDGIYEMLRKLRMKKGEDAMKHLVPEWETLHEYNKYVTATTTLTGESIDRLTRYAENKNIDLRTLISNNVSKDLESNIEKIYTKYRLLAAIDNHKIAEIQEDLVKFIEMVNS